MISRVTNHTLMRSAQANLQANMSQLARLQEQATSQKALTRPSDNPTAAADSLTVRADQRAAAQYRRNVDNGDGWLTTIDAALSTTTGILNDIRDLTVQGANDGAMSSQAKEAIAAELSGLRDELLKQANATYLGRSVFAGTSDASSAFVVDPVTGSTTFTGVSDASVQRRIGAGTTVRVDADGSAIFDGGADGVSVFALVDTLIADLHNDVNVGRHLTAIDERMGTVLGHHTEIGARHSHIQRAQDALMELSGSLEAQRMAIEDVDLSQVILDLKIQEVTYQAALAVTARALQPTLMDFLR
jgi:flagellar hook-associated protein 3 FlgL